jgi:hypothetical protein
MGDQTTLDAIVVTRNLKNDGQIPVRLALFNANGTPRTLATPVAAQANSTATTVADLVTDFNALLAKLRADGVMLP